jgi:RNA polymerase sigma factor (sigma-70 family)
MRPMTHQERELAEQALRIIPAVIAAMGRSFPGIRKKLGRIDAHSVAHVAICRAAQTYDPDKSKVTTYFSTAIRNAILKELAKNQRLRYDSPERVPMEIAERSAACQGSRKRELSAALSMLPDGDRALITSRYVASLSIKEISVLHGINQKRVRARLKSAVARLEGILGSGPPQRREPS